MKKLCLLACSFISLSSFAQTLVQSDLPFSGLGWTSGVDTSYADPVPPGGASQTWDFSTLQYSYVDTSGFMDAAGTAYAGSFPSANLAAHDLTTNEWTYFTSAATGFYVNGFVTDTATYVINPRQMYVPVPFSYGDQHTDISSVSTPTIIQSLAAIVILNFHADFQADGYGTLITPTATYSNTLRVKETMLETDSLMIDYLGTGNYVFFASQQTQKNYFRWFQHGATANYILGIDADSLGNFATRSDYVMQWAVLGTNDITPESELGVYPNPVRDELRIQGHQITSVTIFNAASQEVIHIRSVSPAITNGLTVNVNSLAPGIYFYTADSGEKQFRGRFSVMH
jgi:hypothetical protein